MAFFVKKCAMREYCDDEELIDDVNYCLKYRGNV